MSIVAAADYAHSFPSLGIHLLAYRTRLQPLLEAVHSGNILNKDVRPGGRRLILILAIKLIYEPVDFIR